MERQPKKKSAAAGEEEDRISELSDEILHSVLIRIPCPLESARTSLLSRRWKYLWRSYPIVECYDAWMGRFQRFSDSTVKSEFFLLDSIKKCEIRSFAGTCRWEADFEMRPFRTWFASFRNFIARFSEFQTINFRCYYCPRSEGFASKMKDLDFATRSLAIQHLRIEPHFSSKVLLKMLLDGLFWTCRPRFLTMSKISYDSDMLFEDFLSHYLQKDNEEGFDKHHAWQYRLKNVKIVARGVDHVVQKENGLMGVPENVLTWLKTQNEVRFVLTWD
ncbi:hypothetical protein LINPERPRIM_LOCUS3519 [Linum perenne]